MTCVKVEGFFSEQWKMEASEEFFRHKISDYNTQTSLVCQGNLDADPGHKLSLLNKKCDSLPPRLSKTLFMSNQHSPQS